MFGGRGDDYLNGGRGADQMRGNDGDDTLLGRQGDDVLLGDEGNDSLSGFTGRDIVYGGQGADVMLGNGHDDIMIAGLLTPAGNQSVLEHLSGSLRDEWRSGRSYADRVANIRNDASNASGRLNDVFLIGANRDGQNVFDDGDADQVLGGSAVDLFFATVGSDSLDRSGSEFFEQL